jgi:hypothetical protein
LKEEVGKLRTQAKSQELEAAFMPRRNNISRIPIINTQPCLATAFALLFVLCLLIPVPARACSYSLATVHVSSDFRVIVRHGSTPMPGIKVEVYDEREPYQSDGAPQQKPVVTLVTSQDGAAEVKNLSKGVYLVQTAGPGGGRAVYAKVSSDPGNSREVSFDWPSGRGTLKTKSLSGELASNNPWKPFENLHVELWTPGAETPLAAVETGTGGRFNFNGPKPGLYVLRIRGQQKNVRDDSQVEGDVPLELTSSAPDVPETISLYLGMSTCGITYDSCPIPSAEALPSRRVQVLDPLGAVITHARYRVLDHAGSELAAGYTGSDGIVELPSQLNGKVTLVVAKTGFTLFALPLDLLPPDDTASYLWLRMGVQGYGGDKCSAASLEKNATPQ